MRQKRPQRPNKDQEENNAPKPRRAKNPKPPGRPKQSKKAKKADAEPQGPIRLNRYISQAGVCSRRKADELIRAGQVKLNDAVVTEMGTKVAPGDVVEVNGKRISPLPYLYLMLNKPTDTITTTDDDRGRTTVLDLIRMPDEEKEGLYPVGRLDRHTTGVLLITNDGDLAHRLMHPRYEIEKIYKVRTQSAIKPHELDRLQEGIELEDGLARADEIAYISLPDQHEVGLSLHEGRNRQVRRMFEALGHRVEQLERIRYAGLATTGVRRGRWRKLEPHEVQKLRRMVKL